MSRNMTELEAGRHSGLLEALKILHAHGAVTPASAAIYERAQQLGRCEPVGHLGSGAAGSPRRLEDYDRTRAEGVIAGMEEAAKLVCVDCKDGLPLRYRDESARPVHFDAAGQFAGTCQAYRVNSRIAELRGGR